MIVMAIQNLVTICLLHLFDKKIAYNLHVILLLVSLLHNSKHVYTYYHGNRQVYTRNTLHTILKLSSTHVYKQILVYVLDLKLDSKKRK